jgi:hypothetical protein
MRDIKLKESEARFNDRVMADFHSVVGEIKEPMKVMWAALNTEIKGDVARVPSSRNAGARYPVDLRTMRCPCEARGSCFHQKAARYADHLKRRLNNASEGSDQDVYPIAS